MKKRVICIVIVLLILLSFSLSSVYADVEYDDSEKVEFSESFGTTSGEYYECSGWHTFRKEEFSLEKGTLNSKVNMNGKFWDSGSASFSGYIRMTVDIAGESCQKKSGHKTGSTNFKPSCDISFNSYLEEEKQGVIKVDVKRTSNCRTTYKIGLNLEGEKIDTIKYPVTFKDWDGTTLKEETVEEGQDATAPSDPEREGYNFIGWDTDFTNVEEELVVTAEFEPKEVRCEDESQRIMRISAPDKGYGEKWNQSNYKVDICYDEIFDREGSGNRDCNGNNKVVGLSGKTDAHAEIPSEDNYGINVCYDGLECTARENNCNSDERCVVALSDNTNANLSQCNHSDSYNKKICCSGLELEDVYWNDMVGNQIDEADLKDRIKLVATGEGFTGKTINYTIYKKGGTLLFWDSTEAQFSTEGYATWRADEDGEYYFEAEAVGTEKQKESGIIDISDEEENSPPQVEIINPENKQVYEVNEEIEFKQNSYDVDDEIETEWDFGDGETNNTYNITYSYDSTGQKTVTLMAEDERGKTREESVDILVIDPEVNEKNIFAYIDKPSGIIGEKVVRIDATSTYAIETNDGNIECIAGKCPKETQTGENIESSTGPKYKDITFDWGFVKEGEERGKRNRKGKGGALFVKVLSDPGDYKAKLNASINPTSQTESEFSLNFDEPTCVDDGHSWYEGGEYKSSRDDCYKEIEGSSIKCCPQGYQCEVEDGEGECVRGDEEETVNYCSDYDTEEDCEDYGQTVAINSVEDVKDSGYCTDPYTNETDDEYLFVDNCRCEWDGECKSEWDWNSINKSELDLEDNDSDINVGKEGDCKTKIEETLSCEEGEGMKEIEWESEWEGEGSEEDCEGSGTKRVPCLSGGILSFFSLFSILILGILLIIFYRFEE